MKNGRGGGLELIFLNQVPRFRIGTCLGGGLELLSKQLCLNPIVCHFT